MLPRARPVPQVLGFSDPAAAHQLEEKYKININAVRRECLGSPARV
jgi:hypothetical protein